MIAQQRLAIQGGLSLSALLSSNPKKNERNSPKNKHLNQKLPNSLFAPKPPHINRPKPKTPPKDSKTKSCINEFPDLETQVLGW